MGYRDSVNQAITTISTAAAGAQAKIDEARRFKEGNRKNLRDRIVGTEGFKQNEAAYDRQISDAKAAFKATVQKAMEEYDTQRAAAFTPRPRDVSPETMQFLSLIDLTQGEAAQHRLELLRRDLQRLQERVDAHRLPRGKEHGLRGRNLLLKRHASSHFPSAITMGA